MATVNYSVPEDIKQQFNKAFSGQNKSGVIADLMMRAVEKQRRLEVRKIAVERLIARHRSSKRRFSDEEIKEARRQGRP